MIATHSVAYDWFNSGIWFTGPRDGKETETHYPIGMFMDRFTAGATPGLLLLHGAGNVFVRELGNGQTILIKPTSLLFKDPTVRMHLHSSIPAAPGNPGEPGASAIYGSASRPRPRRGAIQLRAA